jgi:hypothetical protein
MSAIYNINSPAISLKNIPSGFNPISSCWNSDSTVSYTTTNNGGWTSIKKIDILGNISNLANPLESYPPSSPYYTGPSSMVLKDKYIYGMTRRFNVGNGVEPWTDFFIQIDTSNNDQISYFKFYNTSISGLGTYISINDYNNDLYFFSYGDGPTLSTAKMVKFNVSDIPTVNLSTDLLSKVQDISVNYPSSNWNGITYSASPFCIKKNIAYFANSYANDPIYKFQIDPSGHFINPTVFLSGTGLTSNTAYINIYSSSSNNDLLIVMTQNFTTNINNILICRTNADILQTINIGSKTVGGKLQSFINYQTSDVGVITTTLLYNYNKIVCFKKDTQILTMTGYKLIQDLRKGDLVQTLKHGYVPIYKIGFSEMEHPCLEERVKEQLYKCSPDNYPEVFEDLVLTGCHCILVDSIKSEEELEQIIEVNGRLCSTDDKYRLPVCVDERSTVYEVPGTHTIYHMALEHDDYFMNYGIYANGLLVESTSKRFMDTIKMTLAE